MQFTIYEYNFKEESVSIIEINKENLKKLTIAIFGEVRDTDTGQPVYL